MIREPVIEHRAVLVGSRWGSPWGDLLDDLRSLRAVLPWAPIDLDRIRRLLDRAIEHEETTRRLRARSSTHCGTCGVVSHELHTATCVRLQDAASPGTRDVLAAVAKVDPLRPDEYDVGLVCIFCGERRQESGVITHHKVTCVWRLAQATARP